MKKYYKGHLIFYDDLNLDTKIYEIAFGNNEILNINNKEFYDKINQLDKKDKDKIISFLDKIVNSKLLIKENIENIFNKLFDNQQLSYNYYHEQIIYEIITDENDNYYAKELITGNIFPIAKKNNIQSNYTLTKEKEIKSFINVNDKNDLFLTANIEDQIFICKGVKYFFGKNPFNPNFYYIKKISAEEFPNDYYKKYLLKNITFFHLMVNNYLSFNNIERFEVFVKQDMIANQKEIDAYLNKYKNTFINRRKRRNFINDMNNCAKLNVFKNDIIPKKEEMKSLIVDDTTKLMEKIEINLIKLKNYNEEAYYKYYEEYQNLLNNQESDLKIPLTKSYLESLSSKIILSLKFDKNNGGSIINYLNYQKEEYLKCFLNNETNTTLTIEDIDNIMELYLKTQNEFDIISKRNIIRNISLLYLFELYENKDKIEDYNLNNSYLKECIISIVLWLNTLLELDLIKVDYLIDLNNDYTLDDIIKIISNMEFKITKEKIKMLK